MKRFNRSFIGLMEQDNQGEWVRYKEADKTISYWQNLAQVSLEKIDDLREEKNNILLHMVPRLVLLTGFGVFYLAQLFYTIFLT